MEDSVTEEHGHHLQEEPHGHHLQEEHKHPLQEEPHGHHLQEEPHGNHLQEEHKHPLQEEPHGHHLQEEPHGNHLQEEHKHPLQEEPHGNHLQEEHGHHLQEEPHGHHLQEEPHGYHLQEQPHGVARKTSDTRPPVVGTDYACAQRKHSSGDLHSRLKTRKILGVGETDNGDIHRSKISQVLGHNEHLYVRLPRGFWTAHVLMGVGVTLEAVLLLLMPGWATRMGILPPIPEEATVALRVAGAALAGLCVFVWSLLGTSDKHYARTMLLSMLTYYILSICVAAASALTHQNEGEGLFESHLAIIVGMRALMCLICLAYFYSIAGYTPIRGQKPSGFRQPSHGPKEH